MKVVKTFEVKYIEYLNASGQVVSEPLPAFAQDRQQMIELYEAMVFVRTFDNKAIALQRTGQMGTYPAAIGQEAVGVGMGFALQKDDVFVPYYRDQATMIARGINPALIFAYWGGDERGSVFNEHKEDFPVCVPIATQLLHAAGVAYAIKLRKQNRAVLSICGDGGTSEGDFYEAINFAGAHQLPVVFIVNNNKWAISVPLEKQTAAETLAQKAIAGGFEGVQVDGNDVIAMREVTEKALAKARKGRGPTLIEAVNYRLCDHTTADDAKRYVDKTEWDQAWLCEPLIRTKKYLEEKFKWTAEDEAALQERCNQRVIDAVTEYQAMKPQPNTAIIDYMFAKLPKAMEEQRAEIANLPQPKGH